ncbi:FAD dependent oxidoreductase TIGR03364 [Chitinophaga skermanii]|uniref:FAD dependent oxidoreductase TIGR03364 n=1 Tax=Chitinophaga skermanii TaxID=331697 RepID=A0A327Q7F8_9BACT|nr:TIGR03364 family FAD-dependent oxidoreductase [Chitinophaga skermanii]RAI99914.1 FAD dependent oxidoreductase TIGR03364 [Chitinophaga skermanii]
MQQQQHADFAVVGAGIVGLAMTYHLAKKGKKVVVFERNSKAIGASIRNFGLVWPIGQMEGVAYNRAMKSREVWLELGAATGLQCQPTGSLHLAYAHDELAVLEEFLAGGREGCKLLSAAEVQQYSQAVKSHHLKGAMYSASEITVNPRLASATIAAYLQEQWGVTFRFNTAINTINKNTIETPNETWTFEHAYICSGADFETLYPSLYAAAPLTKCKLQMMRTVPQPGNWQLGPALCAGLTLLHYAAFTTCKSLDTLKTRIAAEMPAYMEWGVHLLVSQNGAGELTIGDSHEYGRDFEPFDKEFINELILQYLHTFMQAPSFNIQERWHGIYPKLTNGQTELILPAAENVTIVNGLGGAGMTLSFGLAHELTQSI